MKAYDSYFCTIRNPSIRFHAIPFGGGLQISILVGFGTLWDLSGLHGGSASCLKAEWNESVRQLFVHYQEAQRTIWYNSVRRRASNISFGRIWDTLGHFGTSRGRGKPFEGGMEREHMRAICAPSATPVYDFVPFHLEAAFKCKFWSDLGHFRTLWDILGLHGGAGSRLKAE